MACENFSLSTKSVQTSSKENGRTYTAVVKSFAAKALLPSALRASAMANIAAVG